MKNAEWAYREIHTGLGADVCHRDAIRAALALCTLYEQQHQYPSAKSTYASLWQMFIKHGKDYDLKPDFAEDLYQKYVRVLKQENKVDYQTFRQLAVDYRKALVRFYGVSHETTLKATMQLGELSEEHPDHREEAIAMYEEADQKSLDIPKGQVSEPTMATIHTARTRLPKLYSTSNLAHSPRAIELYNGELRTHHSKHGHAHPASIEWLSLLAVAYAKQGNQDSTTKAHQTVKNSIVEILKGEKSSQKLYDSGVLLANIYLQAGLKTDAEQLTKQLRSQVVFGDSDLNKPLNLARGTKLDKCTWVFLVSFETTLTGKNEFYSWEMANLINTVFMYGAYTHAVSEKSPFLPTLVYGSRLLQFTRDIGDDSTSARVEKELLEFFSTNLKAPNTPNNAVLGEFFHIVLVEVHKLDADSSVLRASLEKVRASVSKGKFQEAYELGLSVDHFQQFYGGYNNLDKIGLGLQLALLLGGVRGKTHPDQKLRASMSEASSTIMKQIMKFIRISQFDIIEIPIKELNDACGLLGDQQNLDDLEASKRYLDFKNND
jgi:tetratricopeptide (TPR) repeat protein